MSAFPYCHYPTFVCSASSSLTLVLVVYAYCFFLPLPSFVVYIFYPAFLPFSFDIPSTFVHLILCYPTRFPDNQTCFLPLPTRCLFLRMRYLVAPPKKTSWNLGDRSSACRILLFFFVPRGNFLVAISRGDNFLPEPAGQSRLIFPRILSTLLPSINNIEIFLFFLVIF